MTELDAVFLALGVAAFIAGFVDAVVGGGGLVQIPALFAAFPGAQPATLFGTNKLASIVGTSSAAIQYARRVRIPWRIALPGSSAALIGAWFGARAVTYMPGEVLRPLILLLLIVVAIYTFVKKDFGTVSREGPESAREIYIAIAIGAAIGFYDGFFGPGTGSFLIFLFVRLVGMDFLRASVTAKIVNVATNLAAISFFAFNVALFWKLAALMACCNLCGALAGSRLALRHGAGFVRKMFLFIVTALIAKLAFDMFGTAIA